MSEIKATLGERMQQRMDELNLRQSDVARRSGLRPHHISELLSGRRGKSPSFRTIRVLARALRVPISFFSLERLHMRQKQSHNGATS
jgi:transcriptional regulator with XRE-family HTH domain